jgi:hypothetical protein
MSDQVKEFLDIPRDFVKDGAFFLNRCTKPSKRGIATCMMRDNDDDANGRIFGNFESRCSGISGNGIYWIFCQVGAYPN